MRIRQLFPQQAELTVAEAAQGLRLGDLAPPDRPYLALNMVATLDGRVTIGGRSGPIGNAADRELFHALRTQVDAVMAGAGTVRAERYGRLVRDPERRERRVAEGLAADPVAIVPSGRLDLPEDLPLFQDAHSTVFVLTHSHDELPAVPARVEYLRGRPHHGGAELGPLLGRLRRDHGVKSILCEGGPGLNAALLHEGLVDELFLSLAPKLAGGAGLGLVSGEPLPEVLDFELVSLFDSGEDLFMRYRLKR
jgi:riboflavin-specific deaminase-like protein